MKKTQATKPPEKAMSLDTMTRELAAGLRDAIQDTDMAYLKRDPEEAFTDLAARLVFRLRATLTVVPVPDAQERNRVAHTEAAARIFDILTRWILAKPGRSYDTKISPTGKFQLVVKTGPYTQLFFGGDIQDVYAQAAQTISFDEQP